MRLGWDGYNKPPKGSGLDEGHPLASGLILCSLFNEGVGAPTAFDTTRLHNNGTLRTVDWVVGQRGWALNFDHVWDTNDIVDYGVMLETEAQSELTVVVSCRWDATADPGTPIAKFTGWENGWAIRFYTDGHIQYRVSAASSNSDGYTGTGLVSIDTWYQAALVFDGGGSANSDKLKGYLDGVAQSLSYNNTVPTATHSGQADNLILGAEVDPWGSNFDGKIDYMAVWNRALDAQEIAWLYDQPYAFIRTPAPRRWFWDDGAAPPLSLNVTDSLVERLQ
jgi:hypothetical protein